MGKTKKKHVRPVYTAKSIRKAPKKPVPKELKIGLIFCACALVLAVVLFFTLYDDGSLPVKDGQAVAEGDNWIVSNLGSSSNKKYYKLGEVGNIEGFSIDPELTNKTDTNERDFWYKPTDEASQISNIYITGVNRRAEDIAPEVVENFKSMFGEESVSDPIRANIQGMEATCFIYTSVDTSTETEKTTQNIVCYFPSIRNTCVMMNIMLTVDEERPAFDEQALLELVDRFAQAITVELKK